MTEMRSIPGQRGSLQTRAGHTLKVLLLSEDYAPADEHTEVADVSAWEVSGGGYARDTLTGVAWDTTGALPALNADDAAVPGTGPEVLFAYVYDNTDNALLLLVTFDAPITLSGELPIEWPDGQLAVYDDATDDLEALDERVTALEAAPPGGGAVSTVAEVEPVSGDVPAVDLRTVMATTPTIRVPSDNTVTEIPDGPAQGEELVLVDCGDGSARGSILVGHPALNPGRRLHIRADVVATEAGAGRQGPSFAWQEWSPATAGNFTLGGTVDPDPPTSYTGVLTYDGDEYPYDLPVADITDPDGAFFDLLAAWAATVPDGAVELFSSFDGTPIITLRTTDPVSEHTLTMAFPDGFYQEPTGILASATVSEVGYVGPNRGVKGLGDFTGEGYEHLWPDTPKADPSMQSGTMWSDGVTWLWTAWSKRSNDVVYAAANPDDWDDDDTAPGYDSQAHDRAAARLKALEDGGGGGGVPTSRAITAGTGLTGGGDLTADRTLAVDFGTGAGKVTQGNDTRLSDARTPTAHAASHQDGGSDELALDASQITTGTIAAARLPAAEPVPGWAYVGNGIVETAPVWAAFTNQAVLTSGRLLLVPVHLTAGTTLTSLSFVSATTAAVTPTNQWFGVFSSARVALRLTVDDTTTAWASNTAKTLALTSTYVVPSTGLYYFGVMVAAGTVPSLRSILLAATTVSVRAINADTGLTAPPSLPFTAGSGTQVSQQPQAFAS